MCKPQFKCREWRTGPAERAWIYFGWHNLRRKYRSTKYYEIRLGTLCAMIGHTVHHESVWQQGKPPWPVSQSSFEVSGRNITQCFCGCARIRTESLRNTNETVYCFSSLLGITDIDSPTVVCKNSKSKLFCFVITNIPRLTHILNIAPPLFLVNEDVSKAGSASFFTLHHIYFLCQSVQEEAASVDMVFFALLNLYIWVSQTLLFDKQFLNRPARFTSTEISSAIREVYVHSL